MKVVEKVFLEALLMVHKEASKVKNFLKDKRPSSAEKEIIKCWLLLRENRSDEILETISRVSEAGSTLVSSQKYLIWGIALNNLGQFKEAVVEIKKSQKFLKSVPHNIGRFIASFNLFVAHYNLFDLPGMRLSLAEMEQAGPAVGGQLITLLQSRLLLSLAEDRPLEAIHHIEALEPLRPKMSEPVIINYLVSRFRFEISQENFVLARKTLIEMKRHRKFSVGGNFLFMKTLLDFLTEGRPIYVYKKDFERCYFLFLQLKVLECLQRSERSEATKNWGELQSLFPEIYSDKFIFHGEKSLFSLALTKLLPQNEFIVVSGEFETKEQHLLHILQHATCPIPSAEIYKGVWKKDVMEYEDQTKLKKLVSRVRAKYAVDIQFKKGCYVLLTQSLLKKSS